MSNTPIFLFLYKEHRCRTPKVGAITTPTTVTSGKTPVWLVGYAGPRVQGRLAPLGVNATGRMAKTISQKYNTAYWTAVHVAVNLRNLKEIGKPLGRLIPVGLVPLDEPSVAEWEIEEAVRFGCMRCTNGKWGRTDV